jgi:hypothetical protein
MFARASRPYTCVSCSLTQQTPTRLSKHVRYASKALITKQKQAIPPSADGQLPPWEEWKDRFYYNGINKIPTLHSLPTARKLVEAFGISKAKKPKVILEAFAGIFHHVLMLSLNIYSSFTRPWCTFARIMRITAIEDEQVDYLGR